MGKTKKMSYIKLFTTLFLVTMFAIVASVKVSKNLAKSTSTAETETEIETKDVYTEAQFKIDQKALMVSFRACIKECKQKFSDRSKANYTSNKRACMSAWQLKMNLLGLMQKDLLHKNVQQQILVID